MKKLFTIILGLFLVNNLISQTYFPFPNDTANWNNLTWAQWSPIDIHLINSQYQLQGDTIIDNKSYNKVYLYHTDNPYPYSEYIGGLREDSGKNIYFYPSMTHIPNYCGSEFPSDTSEYLLYTFDSLTIGMILPINTTETEIKVVGIDSIFLNNTYRKRYMIQQDYMGGIQYWIEGIGSTKDLFSSYSYEFEWQLYTLCFTDSLTYYINSPNGADSCHYMLPAGLNETKMSNVNLYPNPASNKIYVITNAEYLNGIVNIYASTGQLIIQERIEKPELEINIEGIKSGLYIVELVNPERKHYSKLIKD